MRAERRKRSVPVRGKNPEHNDAIQLSFSLLQRFRDLGNKQVINSPVDLNQILRTLNAKKICYVLTGGYGITGWTGRAQATVDVDILVKTGRSHSRTVHVLKDLYPQLVIAHLPGLAAFLVPGDKVSVIDVLYPLRRDLEETLAHPIWTEDRRRGLRYRVPALEMALANKYGAMRSTIRDLAKRHQDSADFGFMVKHSLDEGRQPIDLDKLQALGEMVWPGGGGAEILRLVEQVKAEVPINLAALGIA